LPPDVAVEVGGVLPEGLWKFELLKYSVTFATSIAGKRTSHETHLDSILIDADERVVELTWRASTILPTHWGLVDGIFVRGEGTMPRSLIEEETKDKDRAAKSLERAGG